MKINEFFQDLADGLTSFMQKWGKVFFTFLVTISGFYIAFTAFQYLNVKGFQARAKPVKDTVLVKLVNGNIIPYMPSKPDSSTGTTAKHSQPDSVSGRFTSQSYINSLYRPLPAVTAITPDKKKVAADMALLNRHIFPWWSVLLAALFSLLGIFYIFFNSLPYYSIEMNRDIDPEALTGLFIRFGSEFESIGNPRKIKRLSNKVRFQYYYLASKNLDSASNLEQLIRTLLLFERPSTQDAMNPEKAKLITQDQIHFAEFLVENNIKSTHERFMRIMYALNKDSFY